LTTFFELLRSVWIYLGQMAVLAVPAGLAFMCFLPCRRMRLKDKGLHSGFLREIGLLLFVMTVFSILSVTLRPPMGWGTPLSGDRMKPNLVLFKMFRIYRVYLRWGDLLYIIINFLGNMLVFLPLGFLPALLFRKASWWRSALIGCGISVFVECGQYFLLRQSDIDDVILNTVGALMGYWVYLLVGCLLPGFVAKFRCTERS
jgi:glycopeptide antibiotics resistance protein